MDFIQGLWDNLVPFVLVLTLLVFVHELGHYLAARRCGVRVEVFSIGFGPEIFGWTDRHGTRWKFSWVPLGGYVRMFSDLNAASQPDQETIARMSDADKEISLFHKTVGQRIAVSAAGPIANYLLAIVLFGILYSVSGQRVPSEIAKIGQVMPQSAAEMAGLQSDDVVVRVGDTPISDFATLHAMIQKSPGIPLTLDLVRTGMPKTITVTPTSTVAGDKVVGRLGIAQGTDSVKRSVPMAFVHGAIDTWTFTVRTLQSLGQVIVGKQSADSLSGPIGIASLAGKVAKRGYVELFWFAAFLSINLGLINLFPVPGLDGGHILMYTLEGVRGKPVSEKVQEIAFKIGFACILALILYSTWNDLSHLKVVEFFKGLF